MEFPSACTQCHSRTLKPQSKGRSTEDGAAHNPQPCFSSPRQALMGKQRELHITPLTGAIQHPLTQGGSRTALVHPGCSDNLNGQGKPLGKGQRKTGKPSVLMEVAMAAPLQDLEEIPGQSLSCLCPVEMAEGQVTVDRG